MNKFKLAWDYARDSASLFGGKASEYFQEALRQVNKYASDIKSDGNIFSQIRQKALEAESNYNSKTNETKTLGEIYYKNFISQIMDLPNKLYNMIIDSLNSLMKEDWEIGYALENMPYDILYYIGYLSLPSDGAIQLFISQLINYLSISDDEKEKLQDELESYQYIFDED